MENKMDITLEDAKEAVSCIIHSINMTLSICDVEYPGSKDLLLDVLIKELEAMRAEKVSADAKVCTKGTGKPANDLMPTAAMMCSEDYKERFKAEYYQTKIRYEKLHNMCIKYEAGTLDFTPTCSLELLKEQKAAMGQYLHCLEVRAQIEGVAL